MTANMAQAEGVELVAERLLADARASVARLGLSESDAVVVLIHATSACLADMCGPKAPPSRIRRSVRIAACQLAQTVPAYHRERTVPNAGGRRG